MVQLFASIPKTERGADLWCPGCHLCLQSALSYFITRLQFLSNRDHATGSDVCSPSFTAVSEGDEMGNEDGATHNGLKELFEYPFMSCLTDRRTRRVARGTSINAGPLSYTSPNQPDPLSKLEEAILIVSTGITGISTHDGPLIRPDGIPELATPFLNVIARSASSADNCQATSFFMIN